MDILTPKPSSVRRYLCATARHALTMAYLLGREGISPESPHDLGNPTYDRVSPEVLPGLALAYNTQQRLSSPERARVHRVIMGAVEVHRGERHHKAWHSLAQGRNGFPEELYREAALDAVLANIEERPYQERTKTLEEIQHLARNHPCSEQGSRMLDAARAIQRLTLPSHDLQDLDNLPRLDIDSATFEIIRSRITYAQNFVRERWGYQV